MKQVSSFTLAGFVTVALIIGMGFGYYLSPEYRLSMYEKDSMDLGPADRQVDLRYINAMIAHHRAAMLLAEQAAKQSARTEMKSLASEIAANEPKLIEELYGWKEAWYEDERKVKDPQVAVLGTSEEKFDLRFLNALIAHHDAGILMTEEIRSKSSRNEVLDNADAVENFLRTTREALKGLRKEWYNI